MAAQRTVIKRAIPKSGEMLSVVGMGSSGTFDLSTDGTWRAWLKKMLGQLLNRDEAIRAQLTEVLQLFFQHGGTVIDTSPMYGSAERLLGDLLANVRKKQALFAATKVWTDGRESGIRQMYESMRLMRLSRFDLMQIHNLRDWKVHIRTLKDWKAEGKIRYTGITTSGGRDHNELIHALKSERFDFVQFSYNIDNREAERRLLPLAEDKGIATLINRPFQRGELFRKVRGATLPEWAAEFDCTSWAQFFLKFVISHPNVTCTIPATSKPHHMADNMGANFGRLPNMAARQRMIEYIRSL